MANNFTTRAAQVPSLYLNVGLPLKDGSVKKLGQKGILLNQEQYDFISKVGLSTIQSKLVLTLWDESMRKVADYDI